LKDVSPVPDSEGPATGGKEVDLTENVHENFSFQNNNASVGNDADLQHDPAPQNTPDKSTQPPKDNPLKNNASNDSVVDDHGEQSIPRRSYRTRKPPDRLKHYH